MSIWKPHVTVAALVEREGRFLIVEENVEGRQVWNQPAGHLEAGESLVDAVIRETLEETAHHFRPEAVTGIYRWPHPDNGITFLRFCFCGTSAGHEPERALDDGIERAVWLAPDELRVQPNRLRSPMVLACIDDYLGGQRFPLNLLREIP